MVRLLVQSALALFAGVAGVTQGYRPGDQTCSYSSGTTCPVDSIKPSATDGSVLIYPGGKTRCVYDDFTDPVTGYTTNQTFFFQVFPKPQKKKLALMLQGGGACTDAITCSFSIQCSLPSALLTSSARAISTGIFNSSDPTNPLADWNVVHVPYCTGDLHVGNTVLPAYESGLEALFKRPTCLGQKKDVHLNGFENAKSAFKWAQANYPDVEELVIGGMSAGSLGAQGLSLYVADLFGVSAKKIRYGILADSYIGVLPDDKPAGVILNYYGGCNPELKFPSAVLESCQAKTTTIPGMFATVLKSLPNTDVIFINSIADKTQRLFYELVKQGVYGYPFPTMIAPEDYFAGVTKAIDLYKSVSTRVSTFFVDSEKHVYLNTNGFAETISTVGGRLGNVLTAWLSGVDGGAPGTTAPPSTTAPPPGTTTPVVTTARPQC